MLLDHEAGLLILDRGDTWFEAFGSNRPLGKTGRIGAGAIRNLEFGEHTVSGESQQGSGAEWVAVLGPRRDGRSVVASAASQKCDVLHGILNSATPH